MYLQVKYLLETNNSTLSALVIEGAFFCFVLEDGHRKTKVPGETRIPEGVYTVKARKEGKFFTKLRSRHGHAFVPWLINVPGFEWILIHPGNFVADTRGCLLVGDMAGRDLNGDFFLKNSTPAYLRLYAAMAAAFGRGEGVVVEVLRAGKELEWVRGFGLGVAGVV